MLTIDEDRGWQALTDADCLRLLASQGVGRLGFTDRALPMILPVPYFLHAGDVLIPTHAGSPVVAAVRGAVVVFETGTLDATTGSGWSVSVVGPSRVVTDPRHVASMHALCPPAPAGRAGQCYICVRPGMVRGWCTELPPLPG